VLKNVTNIIIQKRIIKSISTDPDYML
jgi:hypothetical protein